MLAFLLVLLVFSGCSPLTEDVSSDSIDSATMPVDAAMSEELDARRPFVEIEASVDLDSNHDANVSFDSAEELATSTSVSSSSASLMDSGTLLEPCKIEDGFCNPLCDDQCGDKACAYTPTRIESFMCVHPGKVGLLSLCLFDDACQEGLVCESHVCKKPCRIDDDCAGLDLFGEPASFEISGGELNDREIKDVCNPVYTSSGERQIGLRVCNRICRSALDRICGVDSSFNTVFCDGVEGSSVIMCQAKWVDPAVDDLDSGLVSLPQLQNLRVGAPCSGHQECDGILCSGGLCKNSCTTPDDCEGLPCEIDEVIGSGVCSTPCEVSPGEICSISLNCGCPSGQSCKVQLDQTSACVNSGDQGAQSWCNKNDDCASGLSCVAGLCRTVCESDQDCGTSQGLCIQAISGPVKDIWVCAGECDPVLGSGCGVGALCYPHSSGPAICTAEAHAKVPRSEGHPCTVDSECATGLGCTDETCQRWCRSDHDCSGVSCEFFDPTRYGTSMDDKIGICAPEP